MVYSNWCEENKTGFFQETLSGKVFEQDWSGDGVIDVWQIRANHPESDANIHVTTTLTDRWIGQPYSYIGECNEPTIEVKFDFHVKVKNGNFRYKVELAGEKYEWERIHNP